MNRLVILITLLFFLGPAMAADRYIKIISPSGNSMIDPGKPVIVSGTGKGLFEGNVVLRFETADGRLLIQMPTTMHTDDIGAAGEWQKSVLLPRPVPETLRLIAFSPSPKDGEAAISSNPVMLVIGNAAFDVPGIVDDHEVLLLGRRVQAVREAIQHPDTPHALQAITDLGHDQRYYVMVRGWLALQLQGDMSIAAASKGSAPAAVDARIRFLQQAIRAIDLE